MKKYLLFLMVAGTSSFVNAQSVGIGTNTPSTSAQLDVASTSKGLLIPRMTTAQRIAIVSPANGLMVYDTNLSTFYFYNGTEWAAVNSGGGGSNNWATLGNNIYNSNTGNVGIGLSTGMKEKLTVKGNLFVSYVNANDITNGGNRAAINLLGANTGGSRINFLNNDSSVGAYINYYRLSSNLKDFSLNHGTNTNQIALNENGNVGIGKIGTEKLDVNGNIRSRQDVIVDNDVSVARNVIITGTTTSTGSIRTDGRVDAEGVIQTEGGLSAVGGAGLYVTGNALLESNITGNGSASIAGNINSNTSMSITDAAAILSLKSNSTTEKAFVQLSGDDLRVGTYSGNTTGDFIVRTNGANRMVVNNLGNVGIGTTTPGSTLHVQGRGLFRGAGEVITVDGTSNPNIGFYSNGSFKSFISQTPTNLVIGVNGGALQLDAPQIAIGAVIPAASGFKLTVTGKVICEEMKVQLQGAWPDYVFQEKYNLMPMDELRSFINANNHLPNIPAAAAMDKNGIEIGEMQRRMMEKIEELTLYILQLEEKVNGLSKK